MIQIIQGTCRDEEMVHRLSDEWRETLGPTAEGWLGGTYGVTDDGEFVGVVRFESQEAAMRNSARPEQGEWWQRMQDTASERTPFARILPRVIMQRQPMSASRLRLNTR